MLRDALRGRIQSLPSKQFIQVWECIEEIEASLEKAGPTAALALTYVRVAQEQHLANLLGMQQARIANMTASAVSQHENVVNLEKQLACLKVAKKTKRKA